MNVIDPRQNERPDASPDLFANLLMLQGTRPLFALAKIGHWSIAFSELGVDD
jgi:hypothetical protein